MAKISEIMLLQQVSQPALIIETQTDMNGLTAAISGGFIRIGAHLQKQGVITTDIPFVMYKDFESMTEQNIRVIVGFKLPHTLAGTEEIKSVMLPEQKIAYALHKGSYNELAELYNEMGAWIKAKGYHPEGSSIEYYYTEPDVPEAEQVTRIEMPLK